MTTLDVVKAAMTAALVALTNEMLAVAKLRVGDVVLAAGQVEPGRGRVQ